MKPAVAALAVLAGVAVLVAGCNRPFSSSAPRGFVLTEAEGICPTHPVYVRRPATCGISRAGNASTDNFASPHRTWGVAYAFNCGQHPGKFVFGERITLMDHMVLPGDSRFGRSGSWYVMIPRKKMLGFLSTVPSTLEFDGDLTQVAIRSACT